VNDEVCGRVVREAYLKVLSKGGTPSVTSVCRMIKDVVERGAYELIYSDINFDEISEDYTHQILMSTGCLHSYFGITYFDAQNIIFKEWLPHLLLLKGGSV